MKKYYCILILCLIVSAMSFSSCSDDDDNSNGTVDGSIVSLANTKKAVNLSEDTFLATYDGTEMNPFKSLLTYFLMNYGQYKSPSGENVPVVDVLGKAVLLIKGDLSAIPTLLDSIQARTGSYTANPLTQRWEKNETADGQPTSMSIYFKDGKGKDCAILLNWAFRQNTATAGQIVLADSDQTVNVHLPSQINLTITEDNETILSCRTYIEFDAIAKTLTGVCNIDNGGNFHTTLNIDMTDTHWTGLQSISKNGVRLMSTMFNAEGTNLLSFFRDKTVTRTVSGANVTIGLPNSIALRFDITQTLELRDKLLALELSKNYTTANIAEMSTILNQDMTRTLIYNNKSIGTLQFQPLTTPVANTTIGHLESKVILNSGETCMLNQLFIRGERSLIINIISQVVNDVNVLIESAGGTKIDYKGKIF